MANQKNVSRETRIKTIIRYRYYIITKCDQNKIIYTNHYEQLNRYKND